MDIKIRYMENKDRRQVLEMMRVFYASDAVISNGSEEIFDSDIDNCIDDNPYGVVTPVEHIFTGKLRSIRAKRRLTYLSGYDALRFARLSSQFAP